MVRRPLYPWLSDDAAAGFQLTWIGCKGSFCDVTVP